MQDTRLLYMQVYGVWQDKRAGSIQRAHCEGGTTTVVIAHTIVIGS